MSRMDPDKEMTGYINQQLDVRLDSIIARALGWTPSLSDVQRAVLADRTKTNIRAIYDEANTRAAKELNSLYDVNQEPPA